MKNNIFRLCILTGMALGLWSCQETEIVVPRVKEIVSDRVVLIEDFTGVQCTNCPNASREISSLAHKYNGNVVAIAYHTDFLGLPITKDGYKSKYNFTTPDGNLLEEEMGGYQGKPAVTLNRKLYDAQQEYLLTSSSILGNIESELRSIPRVVIDIENQYDAETRKLRRDRREEEENLKSKKPSFDQKLGFFYDKLLLPVRLPHNYGRVTAL